MRNKKEDSPLSVISDMYNAEVEEHDKAGYADRLKEATEQFFKEVNETFDCNVWNVSPVHFSEIKFRPNEIKKEFPVSLFYRTYLKM